jgi:AAA domain-containing protein
MTELIMKSAASYKTRTTRWLWEDRIPLGEITLVAGREGAGKGLLMSHIVARITNGTLEGQYYDKPQSVAIAAHEDSWEKTIIPRLIVAGADLSRVFHPVLKDDDGNVRKLVFPDDLPRISQMVRKAEVVMLALDPLMSTLASDIDVYKSSKVRPVLEDFRAKLERANIACFGIVHFNKMAEGDSLTKIAGGRAVVEVSRAAIVLGEDKDADAENKGAIIMSQPRNNLGRTDLPNLAFVKEGELFKADDRGRSHVGKLRWVSEDYQKTADDALSVRNTARTAGPTDYERVIEFMREAARPVTAVDVAQATKINDASVRVIFNRASRRANAPIERVSRGAYEISRPT